MHTLHGCMLAHRRSNFPEVCLVPFSACRQLWLQTLDARLAAALTSRLVEYPCVQVWQAHGLASRCSTAATMGQCLPRPG